MTEERKVRQPKAAVRLGLEVNVVELEFGQELRLNAEIFHDQGKFSSAMSTFKARALLKEGTDPKEAAKVLIEFVEENVNTTIQEKMDQILAAIENRSFT